MVIFLTIKNNDTIQIQTLFVYLVKYSINYFIFHNYKDKNKNIYLLFPYKYMIYIYYLISMAEH